MVNGVLMILLHSGYRTIQRQLEGSKVELLDWVNENLMDTYVGE